MSSVPRRSARIASQATSVASVAPKKAPRQPSALDLARAAVWRKKLANEEAASSLIDTRIWSTMQDLAVMELLSEDDFHGTLKYLFETLFTSDNFLNLGRHHDHTDKMFHLVQRIHSGEFKCDTSSQSFTHGFNRVCLFLYEVGFPTLDMFRK